MATRLPPTQGLYSDILAEVEMARDRLIEAIRGRRMRDWSARIKASIRGNMRDAAAWSKAE